MNIPHRVLAACVCTAMMFAIPATYAALNLNATTTDGFGIQLGNRGEIVKLYNNGEEIQDPKLVNTSGFYIKDEQTQADLALRGVLKNDGNKILIEDAKADGYHLNASLESKGDYLLVKGTIYQEDKDDHGGTLSFRLPVNSNNALWWSSFHESRVLNQASTFENTITPYSGPSGDGAVDRRSEVEVTTYPFSSIGTAGLGIAYGVPMNKPMLVRQKFLYEKGYHIEYDFGFAKETSSKYGVGANSASFEFYIYKHNPRYGLRSAAQKYYELFPQYFTTNIDMDRMGIVINDDTTISQKDMEELGINMLLSPRTENIAALLQNDGYRLKQGHCYNLWLPGEEIPKEALADQRYYTETQVRNLLWKDKGSTRALPHLNERLLGEMLGLAMPALAKRVDTQFMVKLGRTPFKKMSDLYGDIPMYMLSVNCSPKLAEPNIGSAQYNLYFADAAPGGNADRDWDGVYVDQLTLGSADGGDPVNFNREHFALTSTPLGYERKEGRPFTLLTYGNVEFLAKLADTFRKGGKVVLGDLNQELADNVMWWYAPHLDALGGKIGRLSSAGSSNSMDLESYLTILRTLSGAQKPVYAIYTQEDGKTVEQFLELSLLYGAYPSVAAFDEEGMNTNPEVLPWKTYMPWIKQLNAAGWHPENYVSRLQKELFHVERYGTPEENNLIFAIHNTDDYKREVQLGLSLADMGVEKVESVRLIREQKDLTPEQVASTLMFEYDMQPHTTLLIGLDVRLAPKVQEDTPVLEEEDNQSVEEEQIETTEEGTVWKKWTQDAPFVAFSYLESWGTPLLNKGSSDQSYKLTFSNNTALAATFNGLGTETPSVILAGDASDADVQKFMESISFQAKETFSDVGSTTKYANAIMALYTKGIIKGYADGTFKPAQAVNRAEMLKFLMETLKFETVQPTEDCFTDVPKDAWFAQYVCTAKLQGWVEGYPDDLDPTKRKFVPWQEVQRVEALKMLGKIQNWNIVSTYAEALFPGTGYEDASLWYIPYIKYAKANMLIEKDTDGSYLPWASMTRGAMSDLMVKTIK